MNELVSFILSFRFFNFLFIVCAIAYLIKTRLNPMVDKEIYAQERVLKKLVTTLEQLKKEKEDTVASIQQQQLHGQNLLKRITTWNVAVQKLNEQDKVLQVQSQEALKAFAQSQEHALLMEHIKREMVPCIMLQARQILEKKFESTASQEKFLDRSIAAMEGEKQ